MQPKLIRVIYACMKYKGSLFYCAKTDQVYVNEIVVIASGGGGGGGGGIKYSGPRDRATACDYDVHIRPFQIRK